MCKELVEKLVEYVKLTSEQEGRIARLETKLSECQHDVVEALRERDSLKEKLRSMPGV